MSVAKNRSLRPFNSPLLCWELWTAFSWIRPVKRFQRSTAPAAEHDQSAHPSVSAGDAPNSSCTATVPAGHATPLTQ